MKNEIAPVWTGIDYMKIKIVEQDRSKVSK